MAKWIAWTGGENPVHNQTDVEVVFRCREKSVPLKSFLFNWKHHQHPSDIIYYREVKDNKKDSDKKGMQQ